MTHFRRRHLRCNIEFALYATSIEVSDSLDRRKGRRDAAAGVHCACWSSSPLRPVDQTVVGSIRDLVDIARPPLADNDGVHTVLEDFRVSRTPRHAMRLADVLAYLVLAPNINDRGHP